MQFCSYYLQICSDAEPLLTARKANIPVSNGAGFFGFCPQTERAISWFQSVAKLSVNGRIDDPALKALQIS